MKMPKIDNLVIDITANADRAIRTFDRLSSSMGNARGAASGASGGMKDFADSAKVADTATKGAGQSASDSSKKLRQFGKSAEDAGKSAKKGSSGIDKFWQALKRVAFYRVVRAILRELAEAFKEGITNLYNWSSAVNGTFAKSMDRIATSSLYLKNSLGAMLAPIINTLAPVIEKIVDIIVKVINYLNMFFAMLSGSQTYTVAKKVATTWGDAGKAAAGSAKQAADDIKRTILGFDEINKLEKQNKSSSGGGSGSGSSGTNYADMFEERKLPAWMATVANVIDKLHLNWIDLLAKILAGWAAIKLAIKAVSALSKGWLKSLTGKVVDIAVRLIRKGWTTVTDWALAFGKKVVEISVKLKQSALELWTKFALRWAALNPVLKVGIVITTTALALWAAYQLAWALSPEKVLAVKAAIVTKAQALWKGVQDGWYALGQKALGVGVIITTAASALWKNLQDGWYNLGQKVFGVVAVITTKANELWKSVQDGWFNLGAKVLGVGVAITTFASELWKKVQDGWYKLGEKVLGVSVTITTLANSLWNKFESAWNNSTANQSLSVTVGAKAGIGMSRKGAALVPSIEVEPINIPVNVGGKPSTSGLSRKASNAASAVSGAVTSLAASAKDIWANFSTSWNASAKKQPVKVQAVVPDRMTTTVPPTTSFGEYFKVNWKKHAVEALYTLGIGATIITPWTEIGSALSTLWSKGLALAGVGSGGTAGALSFGAIPMLSGPGSYGNYKNTQSETAAMKQFVDRFERGVQNQKPTVATTVNAEPGTGMSRKSAYGKMVPDVSDTTAKVAVKKNWSGSATQALGLSNLRTDIAVGIRMVNSEIRVSGGGGGRWVAMTKALGGIFNNGRWSNIPQYANGTANVNHGTLFWAGENGSEIVGNVGGRTEVLNRSQLASAMYSSVTAAMAPAVQAFANAGSAVLNKGGNDDTASMMREALNLLQIIADKEFSADVTTAAIQTALNRSNRRAGVTVVPVG